MIIKMKCRWCKKSFEEMDSEFPQMCKSCADQKRKNSKKHLI